MVLSLSRLWETVLIEKQTRSTLPPNDDHPYVGIVVLCGGIYRLKTMIADGQNRISRTY
jgi:hypothetical protein